jgi:hypothetical protein
MSHLRFNTSEPQPYYSAWEGRTIICVYKGKCVGCGIRTYAFKNAGNDPRGPLGIHTYDPFVASEYGMVGEDVVACFNCGNERERYERVLAIAKSQWTLPT